MLFFLYIIILFQQNVLKNNDSIKFNYEQLYNSQNNFEYYNKVDVAINQFNEIFVLDIGNKSLIKLDSNYREVKRYTKEGSGPGEFDVVTNLVCTKNRIIVNGLKKWLFDFNLNFKGEIFYPINIGTIEVDESLKIAVSTDLNNYDFLEYDLDGNKIGGNTAHFSGYKAKRQISDSKKTRFVTQLDFMNLEFSYLSGEYEFRIKNDAFDSNLTRFYNRQTYENYDDVFFFSDNSNSNNKSMRAESIKMYIQRFGDYRNDISSFIGSLKNYLLIRTSSNIHTQLKFDLIDLNNYGFNEVILDFNDKISFARLFEDKLILSFKNDKSGPYFIIYKVKL